MEIVYDKGGIDGSRCPLSDLCGMGMVLSLCEGVKSQKSDYSQISIEGPTDTIALRHDDNFSSFPLKLFFDLVGLVHGPA